MKLIFWGSKEYDSNLFQPVKNKGWNKPSGGLWTSPVDSFYGWEDWCKENNFREEHFEDSSNNFIIELSKKARVYKVDTLNDLIKLVKKYPDTSSKQWGVFYQQCRTLLSA